MPNLWHIWQFFKVLQRLIQCAAPLWKIIKWQTFKKILVQLHHFSTSRRHFQKPETQFFRVPNPSLVCSPLTLNSSFTPSFFILWNSEFHGLEWQMFKTKVKLFQKLIHKIRNIKRLISKKRTHFSPKFYGKVGVISWFLFHLIWKNYVLQILRFWLEKLNCGYFFTRFTHEKIPQNKFRK